MTGKTDWADSIAKTVKRDAEREERQAVWMPSPAEIRAECLAIQREWSDATRKQREAFRPDGTPVLTTARAPQFGN